MVDESWRLHLFWTILNTPRLDWLVLTKRIGNARHMLREAMVQLDPGAMHQHPLPNLWIGATICNQTEADRDVPKLLRVPAAVRFLSVEPMLGPINLRCIDVDGDHEIHPLTGTTECVDGEGEPAPDLPGIDWVICGGESGPKARPMHPDWARSLRDQCATAGVPFLFKQWGEWMPPYAGGSLLSMLQPGHKKGPVLLGHGAVFERLGKATTGRLLDGCTHDEWPEVRHG